MKNYIIEKEMTNNTDGYWIVVVEGESHLNRTKIKSSIQFFTSKGGYDYCHPWERAKENAQAIADGLNQKQNEPLELLKKAYEILSPISNQWDGRETVEGQFMLASMRSIVIKTTS